MDHQEGYFDGIRNTAIYYQKWLPDGDPRGSLVVVHGLAEHCGRYVNLVNHFVPVGYAVYGLDHIGHGKSEGVRVHVQQFKDFTDTLNVFLNMVAAWHPEKPIFLVGHSLGGLIAAVYLLERPSELTGAILLGPLVKVPEHTSSAKVLLGKTLSLLMPRFGLVEIDAAGVSRDPAVVQSYVNDPLVYRGKSTARLAVEMLKAMRRVSAEASGISLPILILQGGQDRLVDPAGARMLYERIQSTDKTIKVYDALYHELVNEPERDQVLSYMEGWLASHLNREQQASPAR